MNNFISTNHTNFSTSRLALIGVACAALSMTAHAETVEPIKTDRPDFVESSDVVGTGRVQVETSFMVERNHSAGVREHTTTTPTLLRIGTGEDWEIRVEADGRTISRSTDDLTGQRTTRRGYSDLAIGVKWHMQEESGIAPAIAWLLHADIDTGSPAFRGTGVNPSLRMVAEWELPQGYSAGIMPGLAYQKDASGKRFTSALFGAVIGKSWTEKFRTFVELAASQIAHTRNGGSVVTYNIGAAYLLTNTVQIDTVFQKSANRNTPDRALGFGLSIKF